MEKYKFLWEGGKIIQKQNKKIGYQIRSFCIQEINNNSQKNPNLFSKKELEDITKMNIELTQEKNLLSFNEQICSLNEYQQYLKSFFEKIDNEDRYGIVSMITAYKFRLMAALYDVLSLWGPIDDETIKNKKYCEYKAVNITKALKKGKIPKRGGPKEHENKIDDLNKNKNINSNIVNDISSEFELYNKEININNTNNVNINFDDDILQNKNYNNENLIIELQNELKNVRAKNQELINENRALLEKINKLNIEKEEINSLKDRIKLLENEIIKKNEEIQNYKLNDNGNKNDNYITLINPGEKIFAVNFVSMGTQDIMNYNLVCKNTDLFVKLEERLYNDFPQFKECETYFEVKTNRIKRFKTLEENKIESNDIINMFIVE